MDEGKREKGLWRPLTIKASKARKHTRHWAKGPCGATAGWFATVEDAQAFCDEKNAALTCTTNS